jgi:hypothetical protein
MKPLCAISLLAHRVFRRSLASNESLYALHC